METDLFGMIPRGVLPRSVDEPELRVEDDPASLIAPIFEVFIEGEWVDLSCYLRGVSLQRGTTNATGPIEASVVEVELDNADGLLAPWSQVTPWTTEPTRVFRPNLPVRISITSESDAALDAFASNPIVIVSTAGSPTPADGKPGDLFIDSAERLWGPKLDLDEPEPIDYGEYQFVSDVDETGLGRIFYDPSAPLLDPQLVLSFVDRFGFDREELITETLADDGDVLELTALIPSPTPVQLGRWTYGTDEFLDNGETYWDEDDEVLSLHHLDADFLSVASTAIREGDLITITTPALLTARSEVEPLAMSAFTEDFDSFADWTGAGGTWISRTGTTGRGLGSQVSGPTLTRAIGGAAEHATAVLGFAHKTTSMGNRAICVLMSDTAATSHLTLRVTSAGLLEVRRGTTSGTVLASSAAGAIVVSTWQYVELLATLNDTTGAVEVRVDGVTVCSASGVDTKNAGTKTVLDAVRLVGAGDVIYFDDLYLETGADAAFLGEQRFGTDTDVIHEPFDDLAAWTTSSGAPSIVAGRTGTAVRLDSTERIIHSLGGAANENVIVGFALFVPTSPAPTDTDLVRFHSGGLARESIRLSTTGVLSRVGLLATPVGTVPFGSWCYVEIRGLFAGTNATAFTIRVNDTVVATIENQNVSGWVIDAIELVGMGGSGALYDDLYIRSGGLADFEGDQALVDMFALTTNVVGSGSIARSPDAATYADGTVVTLTATPDDGWTFEGWSGDASGTTNPTTVTMDAAKTVTATFAEEPAGPWELSFIAESPIEQTTQFSVAARTGTVVEEGAPVVGQTYVVTNEGRQDGGGTVLVSVDTRTITPTIGFEARLFVVSGDMGDLLDGDVIRVRNLGQTVGGPAWGAASVYTFPAQPPPPEAFFVDSLPVDPTLYEPGTVVVLVDRPNRRYTPRSNYAGPWGPLVPLPGWITVPLGVPIWSADLAEGRWQLFEGLVDVWNDHDLSEGDRYIEGQASDHFKTLANAEVEELATAVGEGEFGGARIARLLQKVSWTRGAHLDVGDIAMAGIVFGRPILEEIQRTALTEGGKVFVDRFGDFYFADNATLASTTDEPDWTVSDGQSPYSLCASELHTSSDDLDIVNTVGIARQGGIAVWRYDEFSIERNLGRRTFRIFDLPHLHDTDSGTVADRLLDERSRAEYHLSGLVVSPVAEPFGWSFAAQVDLLDLVRATRVRSLQRLDDMARVVGIKHDFTPEGYLITLTLGPPLRVPTNRGYDVAQFDNSPIDTYSQL